MPRTRPLAALSIAALSLAAAPHATAATFTVNATIDAGDANPGNGICASNGTTCTLRAAIEEAAALPGPDTVILAPGTYQLAAGLDALTINTSVTLQGNSARDTIIRAAPNSRTISIGSTVTLRDLTITGGNVASATAVAGGGVRVTAGDVTLERVAVVGNQIASAQVARGAGIGVDSVSATLTVLDSTIADNTTTGAHNGNVQGAAAGGGISTIGPAVIRRSTISGNAAIGGVQNFATGGGAIIDGAATIEHATFAGNGVATVAGSSGFRRGGNLYLNDKATISGTILAGGSGQSGPDCYRNAGAITQPAKNLSTTATDCLPGALQANPQLGPLTDNGGPTNTMRPAAGSPAIDAAATCGTRQADQRGNTLFGGAGCDLGAVEIAANRSVTVQASKHAAADGEEVTLIATLQNAGLDTATAETLIVELPEGVVATNATTTAAACTIAATVTCSLGNVARGSSVAALVTVRATGRVFTVTARRSGSVPDQHAANDVQSVTVLGADNAPVTGAGPSVAGAPPAGNETAVPQAGASAPAIAKLTLAPPKKRTPGRRGTVRFTLSAAAKVELLVERMQRGRTAAGRCIAAARRGARCQLATRTVKLTRTLPAGSHAITLSTRQLRIGTARLTLVAIDAAGNRSPAVTLQRRVR